MLAASLLAITFKSTAGNNKRLILNVSLTKRLTLFLVTAQPIFLLAVTPSRACSRLLSCQTTRIPLDANFWTESFSLRNSDRFRSLAVEGYVLLAGTAPPTWELLCSNANRQIFSAFCSSTLNNQASVFCGHSYQKTMGSFSWYVAWLKCSFHEPYLCYFLFRKGFLLIVPPSCQDIYYDSTYVTDLICLEKRCQLW